MYAPGHEKELPHRSIREEWGCLKLHVPAPNKRGRPKIHITHEILDVIFYVLKSGCPWRLLPRDVPPWRSVYWWFRRWRIYATFERLTAALRGETYCCGR